MKKATSQDVAKLAGVSQATVSLILNGSDKISFSNETKERVLAAAQQLDYHLPHRASSAKKASLKKPSHLLLVLTPMLTNQYYTEMVRNIEDYAETKQYRVIVCNTFCKPDLEQYFLDTSLANNVDGVIYTFLPSFPHQVEQINETTPVVIIGEKHNNLSICSIELSNITAGSMLIEYLYQLGHRHFAFISSPFSHMTLTREERLEGIQKQLEVYGLSDALDVLVSKSSPEEEEDSVNGRPFNYIVGYEMTEELLKHNSEATAIIGVNDMTAIGSIQALKEHGYKVPRDYSVCGFDNVFASMISCPKLTTIDHHMKIRCQSAVDLIISMSSASSRSIPQANKIEYTPQVIVRESTGPAPTRRSPKTSEE